MGFRFRRGISILPGLKLNLSKSGVSFSAGPKGAKITIGPRGTRVTAGIPGTGLSVSESVQAQKRSPLASNTEVQNLIDHKPPNWEFKLLHAALEGQLRELNEYWEAARSGRTVELAFSDWVNAQVVELKNLMSPFERLLTKDLQEALGRPGEPGDVRKLLQVITGVAEIIDHTVAWEESVSLFALDPRFSEVAATMSGMSKPYLDAVNELHRKLQDQIPNLDKTGHIDLSLTMEALPNVDAFNAALDKLARSTEERVNAER